MERLSVQGCRAHNSEGDQSWPLDARMAVFLLETEGEHCGHAHARAQQRNPCRARASIDGVEFFIHNMCDGHLGFVTNQPLEIDTECTLFPMQFTAVVGRCREFTNGWYEGVLHLRAIPAELIVPMRVAV
jgi:hypothetical protein